MKIIYKLCICVPLCSIFLAACTAPEAGEPGFHAEEGQLQPVQAQLFTRMDPIQENIPHNGGYIRIEAYGKTGKYLLLNTGSFNHQEGGDALTIPRTSARAEGLTAYGQVGIIRASGAPYTLPVHTAPADYPVIWDITKPVNHTAKITSPIELTPAVAALHIILKDVKGRDLTGFVITAQGIYENAAPGDAANWKKDTYGIYQIKPSEIFATGKDQEDIYTATTTLTPGQAMLSITGGSGAYDGKTWIVNVPTGLNSLEAGQRYNLTITLNGERATITGNDITDWVNGEVRYIPDGYDYAVYDVDDLLRVMGEVTQGQKIIQMAGINVNSTWPTMDLPQEVLYNGNGHTITGLKDPLFNIVNGYIYNLHLRDSKVIANSFNCGLLANTNNGSIILCTATGTLTINTTGNAGGLVGENMGDIIRSYTDCKVIVNSDDATIQAGGLAGLNTTTYPHPSIILCAAFGTVEKTQTNANITAGNLVGNNEEIIYYSYATAAGEAIGEGNAIETPELLRIHSIFTDPADPTGISWKMHLFNKAVGNWWIDGTPPTIDFCYEGEPL